MSSYHHRLVDSDYIGSQDNVVARTRTVLVALALTGGTLPCSGWAWRWSAARIQFATP
jgi:hypothetical protein